MIECDFNLCIYNCDKCCALDTISVSAYGMCKECIVVMIDEKELEKIKKEKIESMIKRFS